MPSTPEETWPEWTDFLGQTYRPGDHVVYATCSNSSARLTFARVLRINRVDSKGEPIMSGWRDNRKPSCTVTLQPIEGTGYRSETPKKVNISSISNIIKVDNPYDALVEDIRAQYRKSEVSE